MKKYEVILTLQFQQELDKIMQTAFYSPKVFHKIFSKIRNSVLDLDIFPNRYYKIPNLEKYHNLNIRRLPINKYVIIYQVNEIEQKVFVLHIFYGNQDYFKLI